MKHLSFRILFSCILLPPLLYILSLQGLETLFEKKWTAELQGVLISDSRSLLQGRIGIQDEIQQNIDRHLASLFALKWGVLPQIVVKTRTGSWLYPPSSQEALYPFDSDALHFEKPPPGPTEMIQVAEKNLEVMNQGLELSVIVQIPRNTLLANSVLAFYIVVFASLLYRAYRVSAREAQQLSLRNQQALETATSKLTATQQRLMDVTDTEKLQQDEIDRLQAELGLASDRVRATEDEALTEMEKLENSFHESIALKEKLEVEVSRLAKELERIESSQKVPTKKQRRQINSITKRFKTLYKNLEIQPRAVEGFLNLQGDLQLRAEEFIHNMNENTNQLSVRRKVFSKKGAGPAFECEFGYRGRIYWRRGPGKKTQILVIGTKNSQTKDLAYLEGL